MVGLRGTSGNGEGQEMFLTCQKIYNVLVKTSCERSVDAMDGGRSVEVGGGSA